METKQKTFYIYHVPGVKIGCTCRLRARLRDQGLLDTEWEILETHTDEKLAGIRERELQRQCGYKVDAGLSAYRLEACSKGGRKGGETNIKTGHLIKVARESNIRRREPVLAYRKDTGEFIGEYESQNEAAKQLGVRQGGVSAVLKGRASHVKGFCFKLKE